MARVCVCVCAFKFETSCYICANRERNREILTLCSLLIKLSSKGVSSIVCVLFKRDNVTILDKLCLSERQREIVLSVVI